jgi:nucleoside-diphosphate-sugar epimerase
MIKTISILGCGWLGLPLGKFLQEKGFTIKGSTTSLEKLELLKQNKIDPYHILLNPHFVGDNIQSFFQSDLLIIDVPPSLRKQTADFHIEQMKELQKLLQGSFVKYVIYISSTSVYPDVNREVKEEDVFKLEDADNKTLFSAEEIFRKESSVESLIIRCAGLAGYDRNLVRHFAGKKYLKMGNAPVNLIHRDDVIQIVFELIKRNKWNETFNICCPKHPLRKDLYPFLAQKYNYEIPEYIADDTSDFKVINIDKLQKELMYNFKFTDPQEFLYS